MYSQFDGNAAFSGGGFMPSQATQNTDSGFSSSTSSKNREQGLTPLTVKQISEAIDSSDDKANLVVDGVDVNTITMVGMVFDRASRVTEIVFSLDDGTGRIECHRWLNEAVESKEMAEIEDGMYVRIHGHLKTLQGKRHLLAFSVRPVTNFNEIAYHFIECVYVHLYNTKKKMSGSTQVATPNVVNAGMGMMGGSTGHQVPFSNQVSGQYSVDGLKDIDQKVLDYLNQPACIGRERGVHRDELAQQLKVPLKKIMESIQTLEGEGVIYSTIDDCHFKSAANG